METSSTIKLWLLEHFAWLQNDHNIAELVDEYVEQIMTLFSWLVTHTAPIFLITSPVTSYADQIWSINKKRSSAGFSLDIPLIMLVASILKIFYWLGNHYDKSLFIQAMVMVVVQVLLLHVALLHRPSAAIQLPFSDLRGPDPIPRPYKFWQWTSPTPYWHFIAYYACTLAALQVLLGSVQSYVTLQGFVALSVEALLPIPQILENHKSRSCRGFRLSVLGNWLIGDMFKMTYFFLSESSVPWAFKLCGLFQASCDVFLGVQYYMYGDGGGILQGDEIHKLARLA